MSLGIDHEFVVYELVDPRDGEPFYVGSGSPIRAFSSGTVGASARQAAKHAKVKSIRDGGLKPKVRILSTWENKFDALKAERARYLELTGAGRALTNKIVPGGWGLPSEPKAPRKRREAAEVRATAAQNRRETMRRVYNVWPLGKWCGEVDGYKNMCRFIPAFFDEKQQYPVVVSDVVAITSGSLARAA